MAEDINSTNLKASDIDAAITAVDNYANTCNDIFAKLQNTITTLTAPGGGFNGDSAEGYNDFFTQLRLVLTDRLTAPDGSLSSNLKKLLREIKEALLDTVDPNMGNQNRNAAGNGTGAAEQD